MDSLFGSPVFARRVPLELPEGSERLWCAGDWLEFGTIWARTPDGRDLRVPAEGVLVGEGSGPFAIMTPTFAAFRLN